MPVYKKDMNGDLRPYINDSTRSEGEDVLDRFNLLKISDDDGISPQEKVEMRVMKCDSVTGKLDLDEIRFEQFAKNQLKFMIQEIVFFDKHYSRLYSKIMAIAPLHADNLTKTSLAPGQKTSEELKSALWEQMLFWVPFDSFRPYMAMHYVPQTSNNTKRVTFDDFFQQKHYSSYVVGVYNVYNDRIITDYVTTREEVKAEQDRIERELLDFELDLWEY
jgi:gliding motility associated protien GldN